MNAFSRHIASLIRKHLKDELNEAERIELHAWVDSAIENRELFERLTDEESLKKELGEYDRSLENTWRRIRMGMRKDQAIEISSRRLWRQMAAAIILLLAGAVIYLMLVDRGPGDQEVSASAAPAETTEPDIEAPVTNHAILTLADGRKILLDNAGIGSLVTQGSVDITKTGNGKIVYTGTSSEIKMNTLSVPRGSLPFTVILSDGTIVWLNAASSITYPSAFIGIERRMEITGEAYFEVAHNSSMPFIVKKTGEEVEIKVTGTHFNVNAYGDESVLRVTLLEGGVSVTSGTGEPVYIKPGQQAQVRNGIKVSDDIDIDVVMAWKNGLFNLKDANIREIMRQVGRWYDADIVYEGDVSDIDFYGIVSRRKNVSELLGIMEKTGFVHFRIEGQKIIVSK